MIGARVGVRSASRRLLVGCRHPNADGPRANGHAHHGHHEPVSGREPYAG